VSTVSEAQAALVGLTSRAVSDFESEFQAVAGMSADEVRDALLDVVPPLGTRYSLAAAALGADWYDDLREEADAPGRFKADPSEPVGPARWESLVRWGVSPLYAPTPAPEDALTLISGGLQRTVANGHRLTVVENSVKDPRAKGWARYGSGSSCSFCRMLLSRGAVYTEATSGFESHDHCNCYAAPSW